MKFEHTNPIAEIQTKKKYATFTVREIGGPAEIEKWRAEQAAKLEAARVMRLQRMDAVKAKYFDGLPEGDPSKPAWKGETTGRSWSEKLELARAERKRLAKADERVKAYVPSPEPKKTLWSRIVSFVKSFWQSANF